MSQIRKRQESNVLNTEKQKNPLVRIRPSARENLDAIKVEKGWSYTEAMERVLRDYVTRNRIPKPSKVSA